MVNSMTRFLAVDSTKVDLKERKDKLNNSKTEYLSLDDIRGYKVYTALLTQSGTDAPVATVLENTLGGEVVWSRLDIGRYYATLTGVFTENKTYVDCKQIFSAPEVHYTSVNYKESSLPDNIMIYNFDSTNDGVIDGIDLARIEIRVYN